MKDECTLAITRVFDAPRERVFRAWTRAEHLARWFGPKGFSVASCDAEARSGGVFQLCMRSPEGRDYWVRGVYQEIVAPERLVIHCIAEDHKGVARLNETIEAVFEAHRGRTTLTLNITARGAGPEAEALRASMPRMWAQTVDRLDAHIKPKPDREM